MFAGLSEVLAFLNTYKFTEEQIAFLRLQLVHAEDEFFDYLRGLDCSKVRVLSFKEGRSYLSLSFPARIRKHCAIARASKVQTTFFGPLAPAAAKQAPPPPPPHTPTPVAPRRARRAPSMWLICFCARAYASCRAASCSRGSRSCASRGPSACARSPCSTYYYFTAAAAAADAAAAAAAAATFFVLSIFLSTLFCLAASGLALRLTILRRDGPRGGASSRP